LQQSINSSKAPSPLVARQARKALHELIKSTPLNSAPKQPLIPLPLQDESTLPIVAPTHDCWFLQDGPTTQSILAAKQALVLPHEPSRQTTKEQWKREEEEQLISDTNKMMNIQMIKSK